MSGDKSDLLARIKHLEEKNEKLNYLYHTSLDDYIKQFGELQMYKKALDKACEELEDFDMTFNNADFEDVKTKEQWKEWCMK